MRADNNPEQILPDSYFPKNYLFLCLSFLVSFKRRLCKQLHMFHWNKHRYATSHEMYPNASILNASTLATVSSRLIIEVMVVKAF